MKSVSEIVQALGNAGVPKCKDLVYCALYSLGKRVAEAIYLAHLKEWLLTPCVRTKPYGVARATSLDIKWTDGRVLHWRKK